MSIAETVVGLLTSGGLGVAVWGYIDWLKGRGRLADWDTLSLRALAWGLCIVSVAVVYGACVLMQWTPPPETWRAWVEAIASYALVAITVSQGAHAIDRDNSRAA